MPFDKERMEQGSDAANLLDASAPAEVESCLGFKEFVPHTDTGDSMNLLLISANNEICCLSILVFTEMGCKTCMEQPLFRPNKYEAPFLHCFVRPPRCHPDKRSTPSPFVKSFFEHKSHQDQDHSV